MGCLAAVAVAAMSVSCLKDEIVSMAPSYQDGNKICFGVNTVWEEDQIATRSGSDFGIRQGSMMLRSADSSDSLAVGVYVKEGIASPSSPATKGTPITTANLADFGVWCTFTNEVETGDNSYFSNLKVTRATDTGVCTSDTYYWPGEFSKLSFLAVAPYEHGMTVENDVMPASFKYKVPSEATEQQDIMIATPGKFDGDYGQPVALNFQHLLSAVNVKVGSIPEGTIHSISIKNLYDEGTYSVAGKSWTFADVSSPVASFAVDFGTEDTFATTGETSQSGIQINAANATFMMLPQTLTDDAVLEIVFTHTLTGNKVTLTTAAGVLNTQTSSWVASNTYNYLINIEPDFILNIVEESVPISDCHYDMKEITISDDQNVGWTLSSDVDWIKFRVKPADYAANTNYADYEGYWVEKHTVRNVVVQVTQNNGEISSDITSDITSDYPLYSTLSGTGTTNVLVYLYENATSSSGNVRSASLSLKDKNGKVRDDFRIEQYYPLWNNNIAFERIEEDKNTYPWGFATQRTVEYSSPSITPSWAESGWGRLIWWLIENYFDRLEAVLLADGKTKRGELYATFYNEYYNTSTNLISEFITITPSGGDGSATWGQNNAWTVILNYGNLNNITPDVNGLENSIAILQHSGSVTGSDAETWLSNNLFTQIATNSSSDYASLPETAVYQAVKKNAWNLSTTITTTNSTVNGVPQTPVIETVNNITLANEVQWFLPSSSEVATLIQTACDDDNTNNDEDLTDTYWSSTSSASPSSIPYTKDGAGAAVSRTTKYKVRAARQLN